MSEGVREQIEYGDTKVPILRESIAEVYIALQPPDAAPYVVAPRAMDAQEIVRFFAERVEKVEYLRDKMRKRFSKSSSEKCSYQAGDIAYVMGRPFILDVNPLGRSKGVRGGARGRANVSYSIDTETSMLSLYVMKTGDYDQCKSAFLIYGRAIVVKNAATVAEGFYRRLEIDKKPPVVRMRAKRDEFAKVEAGALWVSEDLVPYPIDCLVYAVWNALGVYNDVDRGLYSEQLASVLPGWEHARDLLASRAKPYSNQ